MSASPRILFAHEREAIRRAVERVLSAHGFDVVSVPDGAAAQAQLEQAGAGGSFAGFVVDVALPGIPGYELVDVARAAGVKAVLLVASVYSRTSYKRRPQRLYGADDYVEIHHLGDHLPERLRGHLGMELRDIEDVAELASAELAREGDSRLEDQDPQRLATLIVADLLLYNGDVVADGHTAEELERRMAKDLEGARELFRTIRGDAGVVDGDPISAAFHELACHLVPGCDEAPAAASDGAQKEGRAG